MSYNSTYYDPTVQQPLYGSYVQPTYYSQPAGFVEQPPYITVTTAIPDQSATLQKSTTVAELEGQVKDLQKKLRSALEYLQEASVIKPRYIILLEPEMEEVFVRKADPNDIFVNPSLQPNGPVEVTRIPKQESYDDVITEQRQLRDGSWANVEVKVQKTRPKMRRTPIPVAKLPKGFDLTDFVSETGSKVSPELLNALRRSAEKAPELIRLAFEKATAAEWGPVRISSNSFTDCIYGHHFLKFISKLIFFL